MLKNRCLYLVLTGCLTLIGVFSFPAQTQNRGGGVKPAGQKKTTPAATPSTTKKIEAAPQKPKRKIIVVLEFDDASLGNDTQKRQMGRQIAILLSNEFSKRGNFTVIERLSIDKVIDDQNRSYGGRYDPVLVSKVGKVFSATTVVLGTITEYTTRKKSLGIGGVFGQSTYIAKIGLAIRLVDVNTGEVQDSVTVEGLADEKSMATVGYGKATELTEELKTSLFTTAANQAIGKGVDQLEKLIDKTLVAAAAPAQTQTQPQAKTPANPGTANKDNVAGEKKEEKKGIFGSIFGKKEKKGNESPGGKGQPAPAPAAATTIPPAKIVNISDGKIYLRNSFPNVKLGDHLAVIRVIKTIKDDETGEILGTETQEIARIEIVEIQEKMIIAKIVSGDNAVQKTDLVRLLK